MRRITPHCPACVNILNPEYFHENKSSVLVVRWCTPDGPSYTKLKARQGTVEWRACLYALDSPRVTPDNPACVENFSCAVLSRFEKPFEVISARGCSNDKCV